MQHKQYKHITKVILYLHPYQLEQKRQSPLWEARSEELPWHKYIATAVLQFLFFLIFFIVGGQGHNLQVVDHNMVTHVTRTHHNSPIFKS